MRRPNLAIVMTDQQQARLAARMGCAADTTPFADALAGEGVAFPNAYTSSPVCMPARVSMLTGRYPSGHRIVRNERIFGPPNFPDPWIVSKQAVCAGPNLFELLGCAGYRRALVGKNHAHVNNDDFEFVRSFHHRGGFYDGKRPDEEAFDAWIDALRHNMSAEPAPFRPELQLPHRIVDTAIEWLRAEPSRPFALWLSFPEPHNPYQVPEPYYSMFTGADYVPPFTTPADLERKNYRWRGQGQIFRHAFRGRDLDDYVRRCRTNYLGMLRLLDDEMRRFADFLRARGLYEDTLVIVLSDHGDLAGEFGILRKGLELSEFLIRIPLIFAGWRVQPRKPPLHTFPNIVDVYPTVCDALGLECPDGVQGTSLWPWLTGDTARLDGLDVAYCEWGDDTRKVSAREWDRDRARFLHDGFNELNPFVSSGTMRCVRHGEWKLVVDAEGTFELFNLAEDPGELDDRAGDPDCQSVRERLLGLLTHRLLQLQRAAPCPARRPLGEIR